MRVFIERGSDLDTGVVNEIVDGMGISAYERRDDIHGHGRLPVQEEMAYRNLNIADETSFIPHVGTRLGRSGCDDSESLWL